MIQIGADGARKAAVALDGTPASLAAAGGRAWVLDADGQTVTEVRGSRRRRTFATGATPIDIVAARGALWIAQGHAGSTQFPGAQTTAVAHVDPSTAAVVRTVNLPPSSGSIQIAQRDRIAASDHAIWVVRIDGALVRIDSLSHDVARVLALDAIAVTATADAAWVITRDGSLVRIAERGTGVGAPIDLGGTGASSLAAGGGAVWVLDAAAGLLLRYDDAGRGRADPIQVGAGGGPVAYASGTVWVADPARERILRVDADERRLAGEVRVGGTPRDLAADGDTLWVSVTSPRATTAACGPLQHAPGTRPDAVVAADLPLRTGGRSPISAMVAAIEDVAKRRGFRAGEHRVGLLVCDDSTTQGGGSDPAKCRANARAYAADRRVVAEIGPYTSPCAYEQLPIAAAAPGGPLAVISPTNTDPLLTRSPTGAYVRIIATDERQARVAVGFLRRGGHRRTFVLDDGFRYGLSLAGYFAFAARSSGMRVLGRASWGGPARTAAVIRRVRRARPDVVWVSGLLDNGAGRVVRLLRQALGRNVTIAGTEGLLPVGRLFDRAGAAASGVLIATGTQPAPRAQHPYATLAARAADLALDAIARSDGTRRSVARAVRAFSLFDAGGDLKRAPVTILRAQRPGGSRTNMSLEGAAVVTILR